MSDTVTSPESFFGFRLGSDRRIARWDAIVEYFYLLGQESHNIRVVNLGPSTEGNPFILAIISSPGNLANLEELREINLQISDPRGLSSDCIAQLVKKGKTIVCQTMSLHASEISATQMAPELAYQLITGTVEQTKTILENTIFLMIPSFNPDGQLMVTDWYNQHVGTEYEGCELPSLYHRYCGHDNNRDAFALNLVESQYVAKILFQDWRPHLFQDHHEMWAYGPRLFVGPYCEPLHPYADPLIWRELNWYGAHMAYKLEETGHAGVITGAMFSAWSHMGFHWLGNYHNIASMLTETAQAHMATPIYIHPHQLHGDNGSTLRSFPNYKAQTNFPNPWPGGWWRLRDMIDQQLVAAIGVLDIAATYRETVLANAAQKALRQTQRGLAEPSGGYLIRPDQHDPHTVTTLINKLLHQGVDIHRTAASLTLGDRHYPSGVYYIPVCQPKRGVVKTLLGRTLFSDDAWVRHKDGSPQRPYDVVTDNLAEMMGVRVESAPVPHSQVMAKQNQLLAVTGREPVYAGVVGEGCFGYALDARLNASYRVVNALLAEGVVVTRSHHALETNGHRLAPGAFVVQSIASDRMARVVSDAGVQAYGLSHTAPTDAVLAVPRIGLYQRFWGGNLDEGWTRLVLEQHGFPYTTLQDAAISVGNLHDAYNVIILPDDTPDLLFGEESAIQNRLRQAPVPEAYRSGLGEDGVSALKAFVEKGGTLIAINQAVEFATDRLGLQVSNAVSGLSTKDYFCPGSMLRARVDTAHPLALGMPEETFVLSWDSPVLQVKESFFSDRFQPVVMYPERDILESGWLIGEGYLSGKPLMLSASYGAGRIILYGFRVQFRAQTLGTFKLLFNALY